MKTKIQLLLILNHLLAFYALFYGPLSFLIFSFLGWICFAKIGGEAGFHRYFAHKSFQMNPWTERLVLFFGCLNCLGSSFSWVGVHRKHHAHPDTDKDPHGAQPGWKIWLTRWKPMQIEMRYIHDLLRDPWQKFFHVHYFKMIAFCFVALALVNPWLPIFLISIPSVVTFHGAGAVNVLCHKYGYRRYDTPDTSTNNFFVNLFTLGGGLHNNHHAKPLSPYNSEAWYEFDLPGFFIRHLLSRNETQKINAN